MAGTTSRSPAGIMMKMGESVATPSDVVDMLRMYAARGSTFGAALLVEWANTLEKAIQRQNNLSTHFPRWACYECSKIKGVLNDRSRHVTHAQGESCPSGVNEVIDPRVGRADPLVVSSAVDHPSHYGGADNPYEAIKVIEAWNLDFCLGNTVKYIARAGKKGSELEDLRKAQWYLNRKIEQLSSTTDTSKS